MPTIQQEIQKLRTSPWVNLYRIDLTNLGGPVVPLTDNVNGIVTFDGIDYQPTSLEISGLEVSAESSGAAPTVEIEHKNGVLRSYIEAYGDLVGGRFYRIRTFKRFLDGQPDADPSQCLPEDKFLIERMSNLGAISASFELKPVLSFQDLQLPRRLILRKGCDFIYRRPVYNEGTSTWEYDYSKATCPAGPSEGAYKIDGTPTTVQFDVCAKDAPACALRFGEDAVLPYRGYPGAKRIQ